jgi:hypothetical protein
MRCALAAWDQCHLPLPRAASRSRSTSRRCGASVAAAAAARPPLAPRRFLTRLRCASARLKRLVEVGVSVNARRNSGIDSADARRRRERRRDSPRQRDSRARQFRLVEVAAAASNRRDIDWHAADEYLSRQWPAIACLK